MGKNISVKVSGQAKISLIIPAYNAEKYLCEALESAIHQSLTNIEILVVDDCSTDSTPEILESYRRIDRRIRILRNEKNEGIYTSRHNAVSVASGEYIMFLDADDYLELDACEALAEEMDRGQWDFICFNTETFEGENMTPADIQTLNDYLTVTALTAKGKQGIAVQSLISGVFPWNVWNKIYTGSLIRRIFSHHKGERLQMAEDFTLTSMAVSYAESFALDERKFYHYRLGSGMSTGSFSIAEKDLERFANIGRVYILLEKWIPEAGLKKEESTKLLQFAHEHTIPDMLYAWAYRVPDYLQKKFLSLMLAYLDMDVLTEEFVDWAFEKHNMHPVEAEYLYSRTIPASPRRQIRTVAMFYHRMYNGGVEKVMSTLTPILLRIGYRVIIITEAGATVEDYPIPDGVRHLRLMSHGDAPAERFEEWRKIIERFSVDAVLYHAFMSLNMPIDGISIRSMQLPLILHSHTDFLFIFQTPTYGNFNWFEQHKIYSAFHVAAVLSEVDLAWCKAIGINAVQVCNPMCYKLDDCKPSRLNSKDVVWVGRLSYEKQYLDAFEIAKLVQLKVPDFKLHIVGQAETDEEFDRIKELLVQEGISDFVILEGFHLDVTPFYENASIFLMTSLYEGFPLVLQEAKCYGLPIVSYEIPNLTMLRLPDSGVSVVPQRDLKAAADRIVELLENDALRQSEGKKSRNSLSQFYKEDLEETWKSIIEVRSQEYYEPCALYQDEPIATAVRMAMQNIAVWAKNSAAQASTASPDISVSHAATFSNPQLLDSYRAEAAEYHRRKVILQRIFRPVREFLLKLRSIFRK